MIWTILQRDDGQTIGHFAPCVLLGFRLLGAKGIFQEFLLWKVTKTRFNRLLNVDIYIVYEGS